MLKIYFLGGSRRNYVISITKQYKIMRTFKLGKHLNSGIVLQQVFYLLSSSNFSYFQNFTSNLYLRFKQNKDHCD